MAYVYLVHREIVGSTIRCTDLIGKVGKGTKDRISAYRTPYGSDNLIIDKWDSSSEEEALTLEGLILDILDMRGWLRYHSSKRKKGKRAEVISFPFNSRDQDGMIKEYISNMKWVHDLINHYHILSTGVNTSQWKKTLYLNSLLKGKISNCTISTKDISLFDTYIESSTLKNIERFFVSKIKLVYKDDMVTLVFREKGGFCTIM